MRWLAVLREHPRAATLAFLLAGTLYYFLFWELGPRQLRPPIQRSIAFLKGGADYEAARLRDGFTTSGEDHRIVRGVDAILPDGATAVAHGPWVFQRHCRYYLYPRRINNHGYAAGPTFDEVFRTSKSDAVIARDPGALDSDSPLFDAARFEARAVPGTIAVVFLDRTSPCFGKPPPVRAPGATWPFQAVPESGAWVTGRVLLALAGFLLVGIAIAGGRSLSLAFLVGVGAMSVYAVLLSWLHVRMGGAALALALAGGAAGSIWRLRQERGDWKARGATLAAIAGPVLVAILLALGAPMDYGDDLSHWAVRAKVYFAIGAVDTPGAAGGSFILNYYPPLVSTSLAWIYVVVGGVADGPAKLLFPCFLAATLGVLAHGLRRVGVTGWQAAAWTAIAGMSGNGMMLNGGWCSADLAMAGYVTAAVWLIHQGFDDRKLLWWGGIMVGLAAFTKAEGVPTGIILLAPALLSLRRLVPLAVPLAASVAIWGIHCLAFHLPVTREHVGTFDLARLQVILPGICAAMFVPWDWGFGWLSIQVGLGAAVLRRIRTAWYPGVVLVLHAGFVMSTYVVTAVGHSVELQMHYSVQRLLLHLWPTAMYTAALGLSLSTRTAEPSSLDALPRPSP